MVVLSKAENEVARYLSTTNKTNQEVADVLFVDEKTVKFHITNIYRKLNCKNRADLMMIYNKYDYQNSEGIEMDTLPNNKGYQSPVAKQTTQPIAQVDHRDKINFIDDKFKVGKSIDQLHNMMMEVTKDEMNAANVNAACNCVSRINETINTAIQAARFLSGR